MLSCHYFQYTIFSCHNIQLQIANTSVVLVWSCWFISSGARSSAEHWCMAIIYLYVNDPNQLYKHIINGIEYLQLNFAALHTRRENIQTNFRELIKNLRIDSLLVFMIALHQSIYIGYIGVRGKSSPYSLFSISANPAPYLSGLKTECDFPCQMHEMQWEELTS